MVKAREVYGARYRQAKLDTDEVRRIRQRVDQGESQRQVARAAGVSQAQVSRIVSRKRWDRVE